MSGGNGWVRSRKVRRLLSTAMMAVTLVTAGCGKTVHSYRYPAPNGEVSLVIESARGRPIAAGRRNEVSLLGASPPQAADATGYTPGEQLGIGSFVGLWAPASIYWVDGSTVNVCPLAMDPEARTSVSILVTERTRRHYRITTTCNKPRRAPRLVP